MSLSEDLNLFLMLLHVLDFVTRLNDPKVNPTRLFQQFLKASVPFALSFILFYCIERSFKYIYIYMEFLLWCSELGIRLVSLEVPV